MNWFETVNKATEYIEDNITSKIDLEDIAKECNFSYYYFSKIFSMITGFSLREYIRNRRITLASYEVSYTNKRIIEIAFKYGYSSNEAFSRAFKKIHGINPSVARKNNVMVYTHFPMLVFEISNLNLISLRYEILRDIEYSFLGKSIHMIEVNYDEAQDKLDRFAKEFYLEKNISDIYKYGKILYRVHYKLSPNFLEYDYFVGFAKKDTKYTNEETISLDFKIKKAVKFISNSTTEALIPEIKKVIYNEWQKNGFVSDALCEIEYTTINKEGKLDFVYIVSIK